MIKNYIDILKTWYSARDAREKILVLFLGSAFIYAVFTLFLFQPIDEQKAQLRAQMVETARQTQDVQTKIAALKKIPTSPLYQEWLAQRTSLDSLHMQYQAYLKESPSKQWSTVIKTILASHQNVTLEEIKDQPETTYTPTNMPITTSKLYQQQLNVTVLSNYNDTISYLEHLESALPHIHWNKLEYDVVDYPMAKVQMEFLIIYDKSST